MDYGIPEKVPEEKKREGTAMSEYTEQADVRISDMELMRKMMLFMRKAKSAPGARGIPGMRSFHGFGRGRRKPEPKRPTLTRELLLTVIANYPEGVRQKAISEEIGINQSSTSELISKLETDGYIRRKVDPGDKRATLLFLTELGQARAAEVEDEKKAMSHGIFDALSDEEKHTLSDLLDKLIGTEEEEPGADAAGATAEAEPAAEVPEEPEFMRI
jgi:DNA-binding MarR family transcriptional regulator